MHEVSEYQVVRIIPIIVLRRTVLLIGLQFPTKNSKFEFLTGKFFETVILKMLFFSISMGLLSDVGWGQFVTDSKGGLTLKLKSLMF